MGTDIIGEINFFSHTIDGCPLWMDVTSKLAGSTSNYVRTPARVLVHDLRGKENLVDLGINGFEIHCKYDGDVHNEFDEKSKMQECYYDEIGNVLKKRMNASRVIVFNHVIRHLGPPRPADQCNLTHRNPLFYPHVDYDPHSALLKTREILGEEERGKVFLNWDKMFPSASARENSPREEHFIPFHVIVGAAGSDRIE